MNLALTALLVFCLVAWGFVLVPPAVRLLSGVIRPSDSIGSFRNKMAILAGSTPNGMLRNPSVVPMAATEPQFQVHDLAAHRRLHPNGVDVARRRAAKQRRRNVFTGLLASVPVTLVLALVGVGPLWVLFTISVAAFGSYTALLWQMHQASLERSRKVAFFPANERPAAQAGELRRISVVGR